MRIAKGPKFGDDDEFVPVSTFTIEQYQCGLRAGERVRLRRDYIAPDGERFEVGTVWEVLTGAVEDPECLWLERPDGQLQEFDDEHSIFDWFEQKRAA